MTPAQRDLRDFIVDYQNANGGVTPSYREMLAGIGFNSMSSLTYLLVQLEAQGIIRRAANRSRRIEVLPQRADLSAVSTDDLRAELHRRGELMARAA